MTTTTKTETEPTEAEITKIGRQLVETFNLKTDREHRDRFTTAGGSKTLIGLYRTARAIVDGKY